MSAVADSSNEIPVSGRALTRLVITTALRVLATITLLLIAYYQVPVRDGSLASDAPFLLIDLALFSAIVGVQVPLILRAKHPLVRSMEALGLSVCLYLMLFARLYLSLSASNPGAFTQPLDHTTALYFTVTVFATVGFGDITAATNPVRNLVTVQMMLNLVMLGLVVRLLFTVGQRGMQQRRGGS